ncbi:hypothetical protein DIPPA_20067 [Diplonema papillatum]|nr:hypothetical protein DIPPA_20067 [Diplonema papillatum]KAJ9450712.1 hypothetical protein DIPPA_20067 [Diplonema papillatum]
MAKEEYLRAGMIVAVVGTNGEYWLAEVRGLGASKTPSIRWLDREGPVGNKELKYGWCIGADYLARNTLLATEVNLDRRSILLPDVENERLTKLRAQVDPFPWEASLEDEESVSPTKPVQKRGRARKKILSSESADESVSDEAASDSESAKEVVKIGKRAAKSSPKKSTGGKGKGKGIVVTGPVRRGPAVAQKLPPNKRKRRDESTSSESTEESVPAGEVLRELQKPEAKRKGNSVLRKLSRKDELLSIGSAEESESEEEDAQTKTVAPKRCADGGKLKRRDDRSSSGSEESASEEEETPHARTRAVKRAAKSTPKRGANHQRRDKLSSSDEESASEEDEAPRARTKTVKKTAKAAPRRRAGDRGKRKRRDDLPVNESAEERAFEERTLTKAARKAAPKRRTGDGDKRRRRDKLSSSEPAEESAPKKAGSESGEEAPLARTTTAKNEAKVTSRSGGRGKRRRVTEPQASTTASSKAEPAQAKSLQNPSAIVDGEAGAKEAKRKRDTSHLIKVGPEMPDVNDGVPLKRKRGRPPKPKPVTPELKKRPEPAIGLSVSSAPSASPVAENEEAGDALPPGRTSVVVLSEPAAKRDRLNPQGHANASDSSAMTPVLTSVRRDRSKQLAPTRRAVPERAASATQDSSQVTPRVRPVQYPAVSFPLTQINLTKHRQSYAQEGAPAEPQWPKRVHEYLGFLQRPPAHDPIAPAPVPVAPRTRAPSHAPAKLPPPKPAQQSDSREKRFEAWVYGNKKTISVLALEACVKAALETRQLGYLDSVVPAHGRVNEPDAGSFIVRFKDCGRPAVARGLCVVIKAKLRERLSEPSLQVMSVVCNCVDTELVQRGKMAVPQSKRNVLLAEGTTRPFDLVRRVGEHVVSLCVNVRQGRPTVLITTEEHTFPAVRRLLERCAGSTFYPCGFVRTSLLRESHAPAEQPSREGDVYKGNVAAREVGLRAA